ncbi:MAG: hypothetical protein Kow0062_02460 [Acidobacteriota bacterium]|nr:MAG: hypothetical protein D6738_15110 [Acidobacteriota bacterium]
MAHVEGSVEDHLRRVRSLHALVTSVNLIELEERDLETIRNELVPAVHKVLRAALAVFERLAKDFGEESDARGRPLRDDALAQEIADLCFVARMELGPRSADLERQAKIDDKWSLLSSCSHAFGCVIKAIFALEPRLAELAGENTQIARHRSVGDAVRIRRVYHNFYRQVMLDGTPTPETIHQRMQRIADAMDRLIASPVYPRLRGSDRCQIRRLEERVDQWLAQGDDERSPSEGLSLWRDLSALSAIFLEIRRRQELIEYDRRTLAGLRPLIAERPVEATPDAPIIAALETVTARDEEIDRIVEDPSRWTCGRVLEVIDRVLADIETTEGAAPGVAVR